MSDNDENFMEMASYWAPPSSPSPGEILEMLNQTDNDQNPISEMFLDHQAEERPDLGERIAMRTGFTLPALDTENMSGFASFFGNTSVPSPVLPISPGFSPSTLLISPTMLISHPSQSIPLSPVTNTEPQEMVGSSGEDQITTTMISNDHSHQPLHVDLPPQEGFGDIPTEESVYIPSHESNVEPNGDHSLTSLDLDDLFDETNAINIISMEEEIEKEDENKDDEDDEEDEDEDANEDEAHEVIDVDILDDVVPSVPKRRRSYTVTNMIGATRISRSIHRVIIQMECEEDNPEDGFRWRKYGRKVVKGNPNPRSYYKCTSRDCIVKKLVERGADNAKLLVTTYDGKHNHPVPPKRIEAGSRIRFGGPTRMTPVQTDLTSLFGQPPLDLRPFTSVGPQMDMTQLYTTGLTKLPRLPVNQSSGLPVNQSTGLMNRNNAPVSKNTGLMYRNDEPVNQNTGLMYRNEQPVNQNTGLMYRNEQPVSQNTGLMYRNDEPVNQHTGLMYRNDGPVNQSTGLIYRNDEPVNQSAGLIYQNREPVKQSAGLMYQNDEPVNQSVGLMYLNDGPGNQSADLMYRNEPDMIPDGTRGCNGIMDLLYGQFGINV